MLCDEAGKEVITDDVEGLLAKILSEEFDAVERYESDFNYRTFVFMLASTRLFKAKFNFVRNEAGQISLIKGAKQERQSDDE